MSFTAEDLTALEARHLTFLLARLVSPEAEREWRENLARGFADLLGAKVRDVVDGAALADALDRVLTPEVIERAARPLGARILPIVLREIAAEPGKVGARVPAETRKKIEAMLARPAMVPDRVLRELAEQEAVQQVLRDVLYDGLKEFSEKVNPFIAEWGIPSLIKRMTLFGGAMTKGLESVRAELDKRMEPEIQRFLTGFTKKGLRRMVEVTAARASEPSSIAMRKHLMTWVLQQEIAVLAREADHQAIAEGQEVVMDVIALDFGRAERKAERRKLVEEALLAAGDRTVGEVLAELGVTLVPDFEALGKASWPVVKALVEGEAVREWLRKMVGEFYEAERARLAGQAP